MKFHVDDSHRARNVYKQHEVPRNHAKVKYSV